MTPCVLAWYIITCPPCRKKWQLTDVNPGQPLSKSWAVPKYKHNQPNFDWTNENSFQVSIFVTDGSDVIPNNTANANADTPASKDRW